jgi:uncharacterized membrane protein
VSTDSIDVMVGEFRNEADAREALVDLDVAKKQGFVQVGDVALLRRNEEGKLHIDESAEMQFGRGALIGGVAGAAVGLIAGPIGWAALGGAAVGGLATKLRDTGFPDDDLRRIGHGIESGHAAVVAVVGDSWVDHVERVLEQHGGEVTTTGVSAELAERLDDEAAKAQQGG